ncbi:MAG: glycosyltransferase family 39 protein [Deltaproteobacteria bacterium]|nr:glycosyltransferase family 39 protein [Deltaproteobacteria bacterium]
MSVLRRSWVLPLLIFVVALLPRGVQIAQLRANAPTFAAPEGGDSIFYHRVASGAPVQPRAYFHSPLYRGFVTALYALGGADPYTFRVVQALLGALGSVLAFLLARRLFGHELVAGLAGLLHAFLGPLVFYGGQLLPATLLATLLLASALGIDAWVRSRTPLAGVLVGFLIALTALARPTVLLWLPLVLVWAYRNGGLRWRSEVPLLLVVVLTIAPVTLRNYVVEGDGVAISANAGLNLYVGNNKNARGTYNLPEGLWFHPGDPLDDFAGLRAAALALGHTPRSSEASRWWAQRALVWIASHPGQALVLVGRKAILWVNNQEAPQLYDMRAYRDVASILVVLPAAGAVIAPALLGLILLIGRRQGTAVRLYAWCAWVYVFAFLPFFVVGRYRAPWLALVAPAAAWALVRVASELAHGPVLRRLAWAGALAASVLLIALPVMAGSRVPQLVAFGRAAHRDGHEWTAARWYRAAWREAPQGHWARSVAGVGLARSLLSTDRSDEAMAIVTEARLSFPRSPQLLELAGVLEGRRGDLAAAEVFLRRALALAPSHATTWIALGTLCRARGELDAARAAFASAQTLGASSAVITMRTRAFARHLRPASTPTSTPASAPSSHPAPSSLSTGHGKGTPTVLDP